MKAMILKKICNLSENNSPLELVELPIPTPKVKELLVKVLVCGVCHTDLDEIEGRIAPLQLPIILGHQVVGVVEAIGDKVHDFKIGDRVGVAWIFSACGACEFCLSGNENLCESFVATGCHVNGGYAEYMTVSEDFIYKIPENISNIHAAPLLCAGAIGYRSISLAGLKNGQRLGLTGFGASGHLVLKIVKSMYPNSEVYVFARSFEQRAFAKQLGADWAGDTTDHAPYKLHSIIDTTPTWRPVVEALANLASGGRLVINTIRKEDDNHDLLKIDYPVHLWREKEIKSVTNITRRDVKEFLKLAAETAIKPEVQVFPFAQANEALFELKMGKIRGAKVLKIESGQLN